MLVHVHVHSPLLSLITYDILEERLQLVRENLILDLFKVCRYFFCLSKVENLVDFKRLELAYLLQIFRDYFYSS